MDAHNFIYGQWVPAVDGQTAKSINPGNLNDTVGTYQDSTEADVEQAVQAAQEAVKPWRKLSGAERGLSFIKPQTLWKNGLMKLPRLRHGKWAKHWRKQKAKRCAALRFSVIMQEKGCAKMAMSFLQAMQRRLCIQPVYPLAS